MSAAKGRIDIDAHGDTKRSIAVLISGSGTTLCNLIEKRSAGELHPTIAVVVSGNRDAKGLAFAHAANIDVRVVDFREVKEPEFSKRIFSICREAQVDLVVLGGFLRRLNIPEDFSGRVINIHPSLIPEFCGKGYFGLKVHAAVLTAGRRATGCTVHYVDDEFDHGSIIAQVTVDVRADDTPESLAARVFDAECRLYPQVINQLTQSITTN